MPNGQFDPAAILEEARQLARARQPQEEAAFNPADILEEARAATGRAAGAVAGKGEELVQGPGLRERLQFRGLPGQPDIILSPAEVERRIASGETLVQKLPEAVKTPVATGLMVGAHVGQEAYNAASLAEMIVAGWAIKGTGWIARLGGSRLLARFPRLRAVVQKHLPTFGKGPLQEVQKREIQAAAEADAKALGLEPGASQIQRELATGVREGVPVPRGEGRQRAISGLRKKTGPQPRPGALPSAREAAEIRGGPATRGPVLSSQELAMQRLQAAKEAQQVPQFGVPVQSVDDIGKAAAKGPLPPVNEELPSILGGPVFDKEVTKWVNQVRGRPETIGDTGSIMVSGWRPIEKVAEESGLVGMQRMMANAGDAITFDLRRLAKPVEDIFKRAGVRESTPAARDIAKVMNGEMDERVLIPKHREVVHKLRRIYEGLADEFDVPVERRIADYYYRLFEKMPPDKVMPELLAVFRDPTKIPTPGFMKTRTGAEGFIEDIVTSTRAYMMAGIRHKHLAEPVNVMANLIKDVPMKNNTAEYLRFWMNRTIGTADGFDKAVGSLVQSAATKGKDIFRWLPQVGPIKAYNEKLARMAEMEVGRAGRDVMSGGRDLIYKGALGLAPGSALQNLSQSLNTFAEVGRWIVPGYRDMARLATNPKIRQLLSRSGVVSEGHWKRVVGEVPAEARARLGDMTMMLFQGAEMKNRIVAFFAGYRRALARGAGENAAISAGRDLAFKTQFRYDSASIPLFFQTSAGRMAFQLGQFGIRQMEWLRPLTTAGKVGKGVSALSRAQLKEAKGYLLDQDVKRMVRYMVGTEAAIQAGFAVDVDLRPWMRPAYYDPHRPGGLYGWRPGTFIVPFGPLLSFSAGVAGALRGKPGAAREVAKGASLFLPAGRAAFHILPRVAKASPEDFWRELASVRRAPERRETVPGVIYRAFTEGL